MTFSRTTGRDAKAPPDQNDGRRLSYNIKELQALTGLGRTSLFALMRSGELVRIKAGTRTLVCAESARAYFTRPATGEAM